jgi:hypothetical protein
MLGMSNIRFQHNPDINGCCKSGGINCCGSGTNEHERDRTH